MTTRHLIDPEIVPMLDMFPSLNLTTESLPETRAFLKEMDAQMLAGLPEFPEVAVSERRIPGPQGAPDVRVLVYRPKNVSTPVPALLWIHGGGYVLGNADQAGPQLKMIVSTLGCAAVAVDYRLAPETPHPGPVEDCYAALKWLYMNASNLSVDATRIAIGGDSAGGGLAAGLALLERSHLTDLCGALKRSCRVVAEREIGQQKGSFSCEPPGSMARSRKGGRHKRELIGFRVPSPCCIGLQANYR